MDRILTDVRIAVRALRKRPGFAAVAIATLGITIGASTAIFSIVDAVLLRPFSLPQPEELMVVWENDRHRGTERETASLPDYVDMLADQRSFESLSAVRLFNPTLTGDGDAERLSARQVTPDYFRTLGVVPLLGRSLSPEEARPGKGRVAALGEGFWRRRFGADADVLGSTLVLDGVSHSVVGVMPEAAHVPGFTREDVWTPLTVDPGDLGHRGVHNVLVLGRLAEGVAQQEAQAEMSGIMKRLEEAYPVENNGRGAFVESLHEVVVSNVRPALLLLLSAVGLVLLIACANVANLQLARASNRRRELAVRSALGAGRGNLIRTLLTESTVLGLAGGVLGLLLAGVGVRGLVAIAPATVPRIAEAGLDARVFAFTLLVSLAASFVFGLAPALRASRPDLGESLSETGRGGTAAVARTRLRNALVVAEVAIAAALVVSAGLVIESLRNLLSVDLGFGVENVVQATVQLPPSRYPTPESWPFLEWPQVVSLQGRISEGVHALPGVAAATVALNGPLDPGWTTRVRVAGGPQVPMEEVEEARFRPVGTDYFRTLGIPLLRGRGFGPQDIAGGPLVAIVNEAFVRRYFPDEEALGQRIVVFQAQREIVGVVPDVRFRGITSPVQPTMYLPFGQNPMGTVTIIARTMGDPEPIVPRIRQLVGRIDPDLAVYGVTTLRQSVGRSVARERFTARLISGFALAALVLAGVGIFGVISYSVTERRRELGVRLALGAAPYQVMRMVLGQGLALTASGLAIGLLVAFAIGRLAEGLLFGVATTDPVILLVVAVLIVLTATLAGYLPARRATRLDPVAALKSE